MRMLLAWILSIPTGMGIVHMFHWGPNIPRNMLIGACACYAWYYMLGFLQRSRPKREEGRRNNDLFPGT